MGDIHSRIKKLRERREISMEALAKGLGVSWQTVQQWEKPGGTAPKRTRLEKVAELLNTTTTYLITGHDEPKQYPVGGKVVKIEQQTAGYRHPDKTIAEAVALLEQTDEKGRIMALGAIRAALSGYSPAKANPAS